MRIIYKNYIFEAVNVDSIEFKRWFGNSIVVDESGNPLPCYRGEHGNSNENFHSRFTALSFTPDYELAELYATKPNNRSDVAYAPRVGRYYIKLENPIMNDKEDFWIEYSKLISIVDENLIKEFFKKNERIWLVGTDPYESVKSNHSREYTLEDFTEDEWNELYIECYPVFDNNEIVLQLVNAGYDGAICGSYHPDGDTTWEIRVFKKENIISAI